MGNSAYKKRHRELGLCVECSRKAEPGSIRCSLHGKKAFNPKSNEVIKDFRGNNVVVTTRSLNIKTLEDALIAAEVDLNEWEVDRFIVNSWEVTSTKDGPQTYTNWQVKVWLKRKELSVDTTQAFIEAVSEYKPEYSRTQKYPKLSRRYMQEFALFDIHLGKRAWEKETNENYDTEIAEKRFLDAISDLVSKSQGYTPEKILFPIGNDFLHVDSLEGTTTKGIRQDTDDRSTLIFKKGLLLLVKGIDALSDIAPVHVILVPGNHDQMSSFHLGTALYAWYRDVQWITVDDSPTTRKYIEYGKNLIGFVHGSRDDPPLHRLPLIMAQEQAESWARTNFREWHVGHYHRRKETSYNAGESFGGVCVRVIPSLTGTDAWHYQKGFVKEGKCAESFLWDYENGCIGTFRSNPVTT